MVLLCLFCCNIYFSVHQYQLGQSFSTCATVRTGADGKTLWCGWQTRCGRLDECGWKNLVL